jgi:AcrR family transcriptional regulator
MTTVDRPLRKDAERNRQRILDAARELFAERGVGVTLNDVAHHAGVGVGTVYRRFPDKVQLIEELFEQRVEQLVGLMEDALEDPDPWHGLTRFLRRMLEFQASDRAFRELVLGSAQGLERVSQVRARMLPLGSELVRRAQEVGRLRPDFRAQDVPILLLMLTTIIDSARDVDPELWRRYLAIVIDGLRADSGTPLPLPVPPLASEDVDRVMSSWKLPRR